MTGQCPDSRILHSLRAFPSLAIVASERDCSPVTVAGPSRIHTGFLHTVITYGIWPYSQHDARSLASPSNAHLRVMVVLVGVVVRVVMWGLWCPGFGFEPRQRDAVDT